MLPELFAGLADMRLVVDKQPGAYGNKHHRTGDDQQPREHAPQHELLELELKQVT